LEGQVSAPRGQVVEDGETPFLAILAMFYRAISQTRRLRAEWVSVEAKGTPTALFRVESQ
jgi:hypothetical protein